MKIKDIAAYQYLKKIGKRRTKLLIVNLLIVLGIVLSAPYLLKNAESKTDDIEIEILNIQKEENNLNTRLAEARRLRDQLATQEVTDNEYDINLNLLTTLSRLETLMISNGFNNSQHEVGSMVFYSDRVEVPVTISVVGNYFDIINFLQEVKVNEQEENYHAPALRNFSLYVDEENYESLKVGEKMEVTLDVVLYSRLPEQKVKTNQFFKEEEKFVNPFGYIAYEVQSNEEGLSEYQRELQDYYREQFGIDYNGGSNQGNGEGNSDDYSSGNGNENSNNQNNNGSGSNDENSNNTVNNK